MAYVYRKMMGGKEYYYLRASARKNGKSITKDIKYLGSTIDAVKISLNHLPKKHSAEIRKTYKTIHRFLEINLFLEKIKKLKLKRDDYLEKTLLENIEACNMHWHEEFIKLHELTQEETLKNFIVEFAYNTTSIEGNTITLKQAQNLLLENLVPTGKTLREIYDLRNTETVFLKLFKERDSEISHSLIQEIHEHLLKDIDSRKGYRTSEVRVFKATFKSTPAHFVKADMDLLLKWYDQNKKKIHPFALAIIFHHKFEKIHPFMDGNGRTGRMLLNYILLKNGFPPVIIKKRNRQGYLESLHKADECNLTKSNPEDYKPLVEFCSNEMSENYWNLFL